MLKTLLKLAAFASCFVAVPAEAQSLGAILNVVTNVARSADQISGHSWCGWDRGISRVACQLQGVESAEQSISQYQNRVQAEQRAAMQRRLAMQQAQYGQTGAQGQPITIKTNNPELLRLCAWGITDWCTRLGTTQAQAQAMISGKSTGTTNSPSTRVASQSSTPQASDPEIGM